IITGTGGSVGREAALTFAREGASVVGCDLNVSAGEATVELVRAGSGTMVSLQPCHLTNPTDCQALVDFAVRSFGRIDVLFNNAAMAYFNWFEDITDEEWNRDLREEIQSITVDVRVIAATNRDRRSAVTDGAFRQDLFYRLNVFPIDVPPLRERKKDVLMLVEYFVQRYASRLGKNIRSIDKNTLELLRSYDWPGNIRELQNIVERSVILSSGDVFSVDESWLSKETFVSAPKVEVSGDLKSGAVERSEREIIEAALAEARGRVWGPSG